MSSLQSPLAETRQGFVESAGLFGSVVLDHFAFIVPIDRFEGDGWRSYQRKGFVTATQTGGHYIKLGIHPEILIPIAPLIPQLGNILALMSLEGIFVSELGLGLANVLRPNWDWDSWVHRFIFLKFLESWGFKWCRLEIAFDFPPGVNPVTVVDPSFISNVRGTLYLPPLKRTYRMVSTEAGIRRESKGRTESLLCLYDRGKKTGQGSFRRFEIRLDSKRLKAFNLAELFLPFPLWLAVNAERIGKIIGREVPRGTLSINTNFLTSDLTALASILKIARWI